MPSSIFTAERPSPFRYTCLDSLAFAADEPVDGLRLEAMEIGLHRLLAKRMLLVNRWWSTRQNDGEASDSPSSWATPFWLCVERWRLRKLSHHSLIDTTFQVRVGGTDSIAVQLVTSQAPFAARVGTSNQLTVTGAAGAFARSEILSLPVRPRALTDFLEVYIRGDVTTRLMATGTYGGTNTGLVQRLTPSTMFPAAGTAWNVAGAVMSLRHAVVFTNTTTGALVGGPFLVTNVWNDYVGQQVLSFAPQQDQMSMLQIQNMGATWSLYELPTYRFAHFGATSQEQLP